MDKLERIHFMSRTDMLKPLRKFVRDVTAQQTDNKKYIDDIAMAVNEACMNVIQHAYKDVDDREIIIEFWKDKEDVLIKIFDQADKVDIAKIKSRDLEDIRPGGLGVHMITQLMDAVEYKYNVNTKGNLLEMRKNINNDQEKLK